MASIQPRPTKREALLPKDGRASRLSRLFRRSAFGMTVETSDGIEIEDALISKSMFFSTVRNGKYEVECQIGSAGNPNAWMVFAFAMGESDSTFPGILIEFNQDGSIDAMLEQLMLATDDPRHFKVVEVVPLYPHLEDTFVEVVAEMVADRIIDDLFTRGVPQKPNRFQHTPSQPRNGGARS